MKFKSDSPSDPQRLALEQQIESLRSDVWQLQLKHDLLKKANELLKTLLRNRVKTLLVDAQKNTYALVAYFTQAQDLLFGSHARGFAIFERSS